MVSAVADPDPAEPERGRDLDRLITFVDAIVAIAITLLVLPLAELAGEIGSDESVWRVVEDHSGQFGAFVLSFVVIARLWLAQHRVVRMAVEATHGLVVGLVAWTLTIVFLPFPTALLAENGHQVATKVFYIGTLAVSEAVLGLIVIAIRRQVPESSGRPRVTPAIVTTGLILAALAISLLAPVLSYFPLFLLLLEEPVEAAWRRLRPARQPHEPGSA